MPFKAYRSEALRPADDYAEKRRPATDPQSGDELLRDLHRRYPELGEHLEAVADLSEAVATRMGLPAARVAAVRRAAELHDVGKVALPEGILRKEGPLTDEEWGFMRRHPLIGERILDAASLPEVGLIVGSHHERYDGEGYPSGLEGEDIPFGARIVAVCDAYHAMVAGRPYSRPRAREDAVSELIRCADTQFDPWVVEVFAQMVSAGLRNP
jgi:HD-GYP domain-containing protein (c-di-GMP phosphodiesterase class II)